MTQASNAESTRVNLIATHEYTSESIAGSRVSILDVLCLKVFFFWLAMVVFGWVQHSRSFPLEAFCNVLGGVGRA